MKQTEMDNLMSFSLSCQKLSRMQKGSAFWLLPSFRHSHRRSGSSPAEPYPPYECKDSTMLFYPPLAKGTFLLCRIGDISTLH